MLDVLHHIDLIKDILRSQYMNPVVFGDIEDIASMCEVANHTSPQEPRTQKEYVDEIIPLPPN